MTVKPSWWAREYRNQVALPRPAESTSLKLPKRLFKHWHYYVHRQLQAKYSSGSQAPDEAKRRRRYLYAIGVLLESIWSIEREMTRSKFSREPELGLDGILPLQLFRL